MIVGRLIGWLFILVALFFLGAEVVASLEAGAYQGLAMGQVWFTLDVASLNLAQAVTQRYLHPALWDPLMIELLTWPGWPVFGVPGVVLTVVFRRRPKRRRWFAGRRGRR